MGATSSVLGGMKRPQRVLFLLALTLGLLLVSISIAAVFIRAVGHKRVIRHPAVGGGHDAAADGDAHRDAQPSSPSVTARVIGPLRDAFGLSKPTSPPLNVVREPAVIPAVAHPGAVEVLSEDIEDTDVVFEPCVCTDPDAKHADRQKMNCPVQTPAEFSQSRGDLRRMRVPKNGRFRDGDVVVIPRVPLSPVPGLVARLGYLSPEEEREIIAQLEQHPFPAYFGKGCQEYGFNFSFYNPKPTAVEMPPAVRRLAKRMAREGLLKPEPNYVLVNRYEPGDGIHPHVDDSFYDGSIASVTLGAGAALTFQLDVFGPYFRGGEHRDVLAQRRQDVRGVCRSAWFPPGSFFAMEGEARFGWKHEMPRRKTDSVPLAHGDTTGWLRLDGLPALGVPIRTLVPRERRYSLTFRHVRDEVRDKRWGGVAVASNAYGK